MSILEEKTAEQEAAELVAAKGWKATRVRRRGSAGSPAPRSTAGGRCPAAYERAYREVLSGYSIPNQGAFGIGLGMVAPAILTHTIPEVRQRYLRPLYRGDIVELPVVL